MLYPHEKYHSPSRKNLMNALSLSWTGGRSRTGAGWACAEAFACADCGLHLIRRWLGLRRRGAREHGQDTSRELANASDASNDPPTPPCGGNPFRRDAPMNRSRRQ